MVEALQAGGDRHNGDFWERNAHRYSSFLEKLAGDTYDRAASEVSRLLDREFVVLELACGSGQFSYRLAPYVGSWIATDLSASMIAEAKSRNSVRGLSFRQMDAMDLGFEDESFDVVLIGNALHIISNPVLALDEARRVLRSDGVMIALSFVEEKVSDRMMRRYLFERWGLNTHRMWTSDSFVNFVGGVGGFRCVDQTLVEGSFFDLVVASFQRS